MLNINLIEAAIRGGGTKISSHIVPGLDVNELLINSVLGETNLNISLTKNKNCAVLRFFDFEMGKIKHINGIDFEFKAGDTIISPNDDRSRVGYFIAYHDNKDSLLDLIKEGILILIYESK